MKRVTHHRARTIGNAAAVAAAALGLTLTPWTVPLSGFTGKALAKDPGEKYAAAGAAPLLDEWVQEVRNKRSRFPRKLAFVRILDDKPGGELTFLTVDSEAFNQMSFMMAVDGASADWDYKLNRAMFATTDPLVAAFNLTKADAVVYAPDQGKWQFLRLKNGKKSVMFSAKPPSSANPRGLIEWLFANFGWDGIVLDQKGDYLLVGAPASLLGSMQSQALAVDSSAAKMTLRPNERQGAGLLSLSQANQGFGIFDIVFLGQGVTELPIGTKLIIEKKK